jgi:hypothetical protein
VIVLDADRLVDPRDADGQWLPSALARLAQDPIGARVDPDARPAIARAARAAGIAMAIDARRDGPRSAEDALRAAGVQIVGADSGAHAGPFVHHAEYTAPPPRVTLYRQPLAALEQALATAPLRGGLGLLPAREVILAHELFHHLVHTRGAPTGVRLRVQTLRVGRWRRHAVVRAAEEIAAAGFAGAWCGLAWAPELLDRLTLAAYAGRGSGTDGGANAGRA